jgi:hypothetical protein
VAIAACLPLIGYHFLTSKYVLSMHVYVPPQLRTNLRAFSSHVSTFANGTILRIRTFRPIFGVKTYIVPVEELKLVSVPGIQAFEKNVEWTSSSILTRTLFGGRKGWYLQPGIGGSEMDGFWTRLGMDMTELKKERANAELKIAEQAKLAPRNQKAQSSPAIRGQLDRKRKRDQKR